MASGVIKKTWESDLEFVKPAPFYDDISTATGSNKYHCEYDGYVFVQGAVSGTTLLNFHTAYCTAKFIDDNDYHVMFAKKGTNLWFAINTNFVAPTFARFFPVKD